MSTRADHPYVYYLHTSTRVTGCDAYRMILPGDELVRQGKIIDRGHYTDVNKIVLNQMVYGTPGMTAYDIFVFPRNAPNSLELFRALRQAGKRTIFEMDDDLTNEYRTVISDKREYEAIWEYIAECDAIMVSTDYLAQRVNGWLGASKPTYVCPNSVRLTDWRVKKAKRLTIVLSGSATHEADWRVLATVLPNVLRRNPQVDFLCFGFIPDYFQDLNEFCSRVKMDNVFVPYQYYPALHGAGHIGLCPVQPDDQFNWSKSGIKAIEFMASGTACVASDLNIYRDVITSGKNGLLVEHTAAAWEDAIETLIHDEYLRDEFARLGRQRVAHSFNIERNASHWWQAFESVYRGAL